MFGHARERDPHLDDVVDVTAGIVADEEAEAGAYAAGRGREATQPYQIPRRGWKDIILRLKDEWGDDHITLSAAGVAFYAFLALIPALAALVSILGLVSQGRDATEVINDLFGALPPSAQEELSTQLEAIASNSSGSLSFGLVLGLMLSFWSASAAVGQLLTAINIAYDEEETRSWFLKRGMAIMITVGALVFIAIAVFSVVAFPELISRTGLGVGTRRLLNILLWPALALGFGIALAILYRIAPDRRPAQWRWVTTGSVFSVLVWIVVTLGFRVYVSNFGSYNETYGSIAAIIVILLWLWLTAVIVLMGAEINSEIEHQTAQDTTVGPTRPVGFRGAAKADSLGQISD